MFVTRPSEDFERVGRLLASGLTVTEAARASGVPRPTVYNWFRRGRPKHMRSGAPWRPSRPAVYAYVLGVYLGDGHIVDRRSPYLRLYMDDAYPHLLAEGRAALAQVFEAPVHTYRWPRRGRDAVLQVSSPILCEAFPQHGPGMKHLRPIVLEPWQEEITRRHPRELIRGLIHSDGCRSVNRFKTALPSGRVAEYSYVRYFFSNVSEDIKDIFCAHCDLLGIRWSRANARYVSVHDRASVRVLDAFVGPKDDPVRMEGLEPPRD